MMWSSDEKIEAPVEIIVNILEVHISAYSEEQEES